MNARHRMSRWAGRAVRALRRWGGAAIASPASPRGLRSVLVASSFCGVLLSGLLVWTSSESTFTAQTGNPTSSWTAGTVVIGNNSGGTIFSPTNILPGDTGQACVQVSYTGSLAATVKMYVSAQAGSLRPYLTILVEQGTSGSTCASFTADPGALTNTLNALPTTYAGGFGTWAPTGTGQNRSYRFTWTVASNNSAANTTASATFTWEAQS